MTVAASSFSMTVTDPGPLLDAIDIKRVHAILGFSSSEEILLDDPEFVEPGSKEVAVATAPDQGECSNPGTADSTVAKQTVDGTNEETNPASSELPPSTSLISGRVYRLPDFVDTDALLPASALAQSNLFREQFGAFCLLHTHPDFRQRVKDGQNIVVAGEAFGCGSSREDAVFALKGAGVQCVIAKSFAFIYGRNQPNLGLLGIEINDPLFWAIVDHNKSVKIDLDRALVQLEVNSGFWESFSFRLSPMQRRLMECGGVEKAFNKYGKRVWQALTTPASDAQSSVKSPVTPALDADPKTTEW